MRDNNDEAEVEVGVMRTRMARDDNHDDDNNDNEDNNHKGTDVADYKN